jgi:hypothetical protein
VIGGIRLLAQHRKELLIGVSGHLLRLDPVSKVEAVVPLGFDRWRGQKQRTTEVARNACLCERFDGGLPRECKGPLDRVGGGMSMKSTVPQMRVDRPSDGNRVIG